MNELALPWMVIGGVAVIAAGVPRETIDVDATVLGRSSDLDTLLAALERNGITPRGPEARQIARERSLIVDIATMLDDPSRVVEFDALVARARRAKGASC